MHYENYRSDRLSKNTLSTQESTTSLRSEGEERIIEELQEKEAQIKKMQEMMAKMQAQLQDKNWSNSRMEYMWWSFFQCLIQDFKNNHDLINFLL